ncbi:TOPRIM nucleotidyl transferase/hydrolase domain-containing protein [Actinoplanes sp. URMC 104]|uniref:TOPRIM nucleotidyl transferase/hydrolase domain-containing protein n=1 Tax=Actinoplanes sp. URMC 104 TaxID=3423409 RepID=UPI003F1A8F08
MLDRHASLPATARAPAEVGDAETLMLVEGVSDRIAVETAAAGLGRDLTAERVLVVPIGGAHAIARFVAGLGPFGERVRLAALCDQREEFLFRRALHPLPRATLHVCVEDLEDELIRAVGVAHVEAVFAAQGDSRAFRSMRAQPAWRGRDPAAQMRRFLGSGSTRKSRYAAALTEAALTRDALPRPLAQLLATRTSRS